MGLVFASLACNNHIFVRINSHMKEKPVKRWWHWKDGGCCAGLEKGLTQTPSRYMRKDICQALSKQTHKSSRLHYQRLDFVVKLFFLLFFFLFPFFYLFPCFKYTLRVERISQKILINFNFLYNRIYFFFFYFFLTHSQSHLLFPFQTYMLGVLTLFHTKILLSFFPSV